jgi:iron complex outermembrane receptor protein
MPAHRTVSAHRALNLASRGHLGLAVLGVLAAAGPAAAAQLDEIIVTAQRREESLQDIPVSVTAFTQMALEERLVTGMADLARFTPNLEINNGRSDGGGSNAAIFIRGVGQFDFIFPTDPGVGIYLDGVYMGRTLGGMMDLADLERVEVLRGPQGTLYGKNTIAGAVNLVTARPSGEFGGMARVTGGELSRMDGELSVNFPVIEGRLNGKLALVTRSRDGIGRSLVDGRDFDDINRQSARAVFDWIPSDDVSVLFTADYSTWSQNGSMALLTSVYPSSNGFRELFNALGAPFLAARDGLPAGAVFDERWVTNDPETTWANGPVNDDGDVWGISATVDWNLTDKTRLKSITSWREMDLHFGSDLDNTPFDFAQTNQRNRQDQFAQEFHLAGLSLNDRADWLLGVYYFRETGDDANDVHFGHGLLDALEAFPGPVIPLGPYPCPQPEGSPAPCLGGAGNPANFILETDLLPATSITTESYSVFSHVIFKLSDRANLNAGLRFTKEDKEWFIVESRPVTGRYVVPPTVLQEDWSDVSPRIGLDYQLTDDLMIYGSISEGFKSGGWNPRMFDPTNLVGYDPEYLTSYEFGFKSQWFDRRLVLNGAFFYYEYEDLQLSSFEPGADPTNVTLTVSNAGEVEIMGFELEIAARPAPGLDLQLGIGYQTNEYQSLADSVPWSLDNVLPDAPKWSINAGVQYAIALGDAGTLVPRLDASYKSTTFKDTYNSEDIAQPALWLLNAQLAWQAADERWAVTAFVTNLTDEEYITRGLHFSDFGFTTVYPGRPREWGLSATFRF